MPEHVQPPATDERGASAVEYGLMVALIAAVILVVVASLGSETSGLFSTICSPPSPFEC